MSLITDEIRAAASEIYHGDEICQEKSKFLLTEMGLPNGLLPLKDMEEAGYIKDTGFVWLIQKQKSQHKFEKIGKLVQYAKEVTAVIQPGKIKKLTGVKTKELLLWINLSDIDLDNTGRITFRTPAGLFRSFPAEAFQIEETVVTEKKIEIDPPKVIPAATAAAAVEEKKEEAKGDASAEGKEDVSAEVKEKEVEKVAAAIAVVEVKEA